ncbi:MAG: TatD family hydrolase [Myxococcales bacterium]|nr:TatD family hydrolase [Myxococcales bacterium]
MSGLVDIGANLAHRSFRGDLGEVLEGAARAGVGAIVVTGTSVTASAAAADLAARERAGPVALTSTAGIHPHEARTFGPLAAATLRELAQRDVVVAVGECGRDYNRDFSPRPAQRACFEAQLELAAELRMPVFMHERDAHDDFLAVVRRHRPRLVAAVVHCFTGTAREAEAYLDLDLHLGITGWICDERRGRHLADVVRAIPEDRLMIETDAPFLLPRDLPAAPSSRRNEPRFLPHVLRAVARARGADEAAVAASTSRVARSFFGLGG